MALLFQYQPRWGSRAGFIITRTVLRKTGSSLFTYIIAGSARPPRKLFAATLLAEINSVIKEYSCSNEATVTTDTQINRKVLK